MKYLSLLAFDLKALRLFHIDSLVTFGYKSSLLSTICFDVEDPSIFDHLVTMRELY